MKHYYVDHLYGGLYSSNRKLSYDETYCDTCGDEDIYLGAFETEEEASLEYRKYKGEYMTKEEILNAVATVEDTCARNRMGCSENWYNVYYALKHTFTSDELKAMTEEELNHLVRLGDAIAEGLY